MINRIEQIYDDSKDKKKFQPIVKLTLPFSKKICDCDSKEILKQLEKEELTKFLSLLMKENINISTLMPIYDKVVDDLKMRGRLKSFWNIL